jgi:hypothetical protein
MDKSTFEKYLKYRPKPLEHLFYWIMIFVYCGSFLLAFLFSWKYFPILQNYLYTKNNNIIFSLYGNGIFSLSFLFLTILINWYIIKTIFLFIPGFKNVILYYDVSGSKTYNYNIYKKKNKTYFVFILIIMIIALFFSIISLFVHLRINESGIYYNQIFNYKEKYYSWNELKSFSINIKVSQGKNNSKYLSPEMVMEFGENKIDLWDGAGLGTPDSETLIKVIELVKEKTHILIDFDNNLTDETLDLLYNNSTEKKRNNIINVFNYLAKEQ